jgi:hypothetical protein
MNTAVEEVAICDNFIADVGYGALRLAQTSRASYFSFI